MQGQKKANKSQLVFSQRLPLFCRSSLLSPSHFLSAFQCFWPNSGQIIPSLSPEQKTHYKGTFKVSQGSWQMQSTQAIASGMGAAGKLPQKTTAAHQRGKFHRDDCRGGKGRRGSWGHIRACAHAGLPGTFTPQSVLLPPHSPPPPKAHCPFAKAKLGLFSATPCTSQLAIEVAVDRMARAGAGHGQVARHARRGAECRRGAQCRGRQKRENDYFFPARPLENGLRLRNLSSNDRNKN